VPRPPRSTLIVAGIILASLILDLTWIAHRVPHHLDGDEWRYLYYADNLLNGFFSPRPRVFLWNGPGYPLFLIPFVKARWPDGARYANAFLHAATLVYAFLILRQRVALRWVLGAVIVLAVYPPLFEFLPLAQTEVLCYLLTTAWLHHSLAAVDSRAHRLAAALLMAALCLTKVVFGVVLMVFVPVMLVSWLVRRDRVGSSFLQAGALALALCVPWLVYTQRLTGRFLYWSSAGPMSFYWMTAPYPGEWGDWYHHGWVYRNATLRAHHKAVFDQTTGLARDPHTSFDEQMFNTSTPEAADIFAREGMKNLRAHPGAYLRNWVANVSRLFLDVPTSVRGLRPVNQYSLTHLSLLAATVLAAAIALRKKLRLPAGWGPPLLFLALSFAVYSINAAFARFTVPLVPLWWLITCRWVGQVR
jgi:hypothetical protein